MPKKRLAMKEKFTTSQKPLKEGQSEDTISILTPSHFFFFLELLTVTEKTS